MVAGYHDYARVYWAPPAGGAKVDHYEVQRTAINSEAPQELWQYVPTVILDGAPVDAFAPADEATMATVTEEGLASTDPVAFARNRLVIVTKPGNPEHIDGLADLTDVGTIALCGEDIPCGSLAEQALEDADVSIPEPSVTRGQNAKGTLAAVSEGDAVAGIVYRTDAMAARGRVGTVEIPGRAKVTTTYPIAVLDGTDEPALARAFVRFVSSADGSAILAARGFLPAP
jgi:molybdate transport system substrate-binding protein